MNDKTVLVIDDDDMIRHLIEQYLVRAGFQTKTASDGPSAVATYLDAQPDLIVLDVAMPGMSGFDVAKRIREIERDEKRARTPIILLTAYARSFFMSVGSQAGIDSYLTKPISPDTLLEHVRKFLEDKPASASSTGQT